jgi:uncharacterized protein (TIGR02246 family)
MRIWCVLAGISLALVSAGCQPAAEAPAPTETPAMSDEDMIKERVDAFVAAWSNGDAEAIGVLFTEGADLIGPVGDRHHGRDAIVARYSELFQTMYQGAKVSISMTSTRFLKPDVAVVDGSFEITGMKSADGAEMPPMTGLYTNVTVKQDGSWLIHCSRPMVPVKESGT